MLNAGTIVPAAVKDYDFARRRKLLDVSLHEHLAFLPLRRRRQGDNPKCTWADPLRNRSDRTAFASSVASFESDNDAQAFLFDPLLQVTKLHLKFAQFLLIVFALHPRGTIILGLLVLGILAH